MTDLEKAARMALEALEYYQIAGLATTRVVDSIIALRQALSSGVEQPAQQEPTGYTAGINWQPRQSEMVVKIVRNKQPEHGFVRAIYTSPQPAQQQEWRGPVDWEAVAADQAMTIAMMKVAQEAAVLAEREALEEMDWTWLMRQGALVTWDDAETLGDRVRAAIRERNIK